MPEDGVRGDSIDQKALEAFVKKVLARIDTESTGLYNHALPLLGEPFSRKTNQNTEGLNPRCHCDAAGFEVCS